MEDPKVIEMAGEVEGKFVKYEDYLKLKSEYDELNDWHNSQARELLLENKKLKKNQFTVHEVVWRDGVIISELPNDIGAFYVVKLKNGIVAVAELCRGYDETIYLDGYDEWEDLESWAELPEM